MELNQLNEFSGGRYDSSLNVKDVLEKYTAHLKWFILCIVLFAAGTYFYLMTVAPEYSISATILIKDKEKESSFADLSAFEGLSLLGGGDKGLENEILILKSRKLMSKVVQELKLNTRYFIESGFYDKELYPNFPIMIQYESDSIQKESEKYPTEFRVNIRSKDKFDFIDSEGNSSRHNFGESFKADLGNEMKSNMQNISLIRSDDFDESYIGMTVLVTISPIERVVSRFMDIVVIEPLSENASQVLEISIRGAVVHKG